MYLVDEFMRDRRNVFDMLVEHALEEYRAGETTDLRVLAKQMGVEVGDYLDTIFCGDALEVLKQLPDKCIDLAITSPPYYKVRDYGIPGQLGQEDTPREYVANLVAISQEVHRVLKDGGSFFLNIADSANGSGGAGGDYNKGGNREGQVRYKGRNIPGIPKKSLLGIPERVKLAHLDDGWVYRSDIVWEKPNAYGDAARDRPHRSHEYLIHFTKKSHYYYDESELKEMGVSGKPRQMRTVWSIPTKPLKGYGKIHTATYPPDLIRVPIKAYCPPGGVVLDYFIGAGTSALVALEEGRHFVGIELSRMYIEQVAVPRLKEAGYDVKVRET